MHGRGFSHANRLDAADEESRAMLTSSGMRSETSICMKNRSEEANAANWYLITYLQVMAISGTLSNADESPKRRSMGRRV
jgi:hypothetical protein